MAVVASVPAAVRRTTISGTLLAGAATRWKDSLRQTVEFGLTPEYFLRAVAERRIPDYITNPETGKTISCFEDLQLLPKAAFPVPDPLEPGLLRPAGYYNLKAVSAIADTHVIVIDEERTFMDGFRQMAAEAGISDPIFVAQSRRGMSKVLGHGDAAFQMMNNPLIREMGHLEYCFINFGSDVSSPATAAASINTLSENQEIWSLLPTMMMQDPPYAIVEVDGQIKFWHPKLMGSAYKGMAPTNVGAWAFRMAPFREVLDFMGNTFEEGSGYHIEGNATNEFALDNVVQYIAAQNRFLYPVLAQEYELHPLKSFYTSEFVEYISALKRMLLDIG